MQAEKTSSEHGSNTLEKSLLLMETSENGQSLCHLDIASAIGAPSGRLPHFFMYT